MPERIPLNSIIDFKLTLCPAIDTPPMRGILRRYCRLPGWQSVHNNQTNTVGYYPVELAMVELPITGMIRIDTNCIIGCANMEVR